MTDLQGIKRAQERVNERLLTMYDSSVSHWHSRLSDSAVATAVASFALWCLDCDRHADVVKRGHEWLRQDQNPDGGWGDSPDSPSNLSATLLAWSALAEAEAHTACEKAELWLDARLGGHDAAHIRQGIVGRYGSDRTFACPILTMCALAGRLGSGTRAWRQVPQLPFELSVLPAGLFRFLRLTVVSYALPALIGMGLVRHTHYPTRWFPLRWLRSLLRRRVLAIAERMQPENGGYEEAAPLVGFVMMSLAAAGHARHKVVTKAAGFLLASQRANGSWPIDTNLDTWVTVLATQALTHRGGPGLPDDKRYDIGQWLLGQQHDATHPLTFGAPGGWGWSDLPGAMPDADDTSGVLLALRRLGLSDADTVSPATHGICWVMDVQNSDGGIPTFSRGWGALPFDRSCPDITAHALHAFVAWVEDMPPPLARRMRRSMRRMHEYLHASQDVNGCWDPLWFGTQHTDDEKNRVYGTARAVISLRASGSDCETELVQAGVEFLRLAQNSDGGWGAQPALGSTMEETAMATWAMADAGERSAALCGAAWLASRIASMPPPGPIGLYFDRLWYAEEMYPLLFAAGALNATHGLLAND